MTNRRRTYLVDKKFQFKYLFYTTCLLMLYSLLVVESVYAPYVYSMFSSAPIEQKFETSRIIISLHSYVWFVILAVTVLLGILSIYMTHRIAGPIYRMKNDLKIMADGNLAKRIVLRKHDEFKELADECNRFAESMSNTFAFLKEQSDQLSARLDAAEAELARTASSESVLQSIANVRETEKILRDAVARIQV